MYKVVVNEKGDYTCPDLMISKDEWLSLLEDSSVFTSQFLDELLHLYRQPMHKATCSEISKEHGRLSSKGYRNNIVALAKRVCKAKGLHLVGTDDQPTYWIVLATGRHVKKRQGIFEWELRPELVEALDEFLSEDGIEPEDDSPAPIVDYVVEVPGDGMEGKKVVVFSTRYERSKENRKDAIKYHGTRCMACGIDFGEVYGEVGRGFIEVHHIVPLSQSHEKVSVNPKTDLVCLCANCHRMVHRRHNAILSVEELRQIILARRIDA